ncbi:hypothetical protein NY148_09830 [Porphyromonas gingivalis]|uniref:hypothetical protein n=1 Tax=Porphyromonas gingivalis TaxID=837 RepID=UPI001E416B24|nr:hypothetical protein [Porphyromonas gingivalis]USI93949.1 hypothetical protein MCS24_09600 [Porphyromonas gingivalis]USI96918.1 hypothetical protein MCS27_09620 [Porphyromonas gingivalis]USI97747.1 hypothetical protein MCS25_09640 [Porphyromonas gingivalis]WCG02145.1 hypothetical protein NY148_09830 [Porphyromonas gingivalis]
MRKFFTSHAKTKQFTHHVFRGHKHENFGAQTDLELSPTPEHPECRAGAFCHHSSR